MTPVRWAVLGLGWGGLPHTHAVADVESAALVGVCDQDPAKRDDWTRKSEIAAFDSLDALLASAVPDVVTVATPPHTHFPIAAQLLAEGIHVVLEKPPCLTVEDLDQLVLLESSAARVFPIVQYRYHPALRELRDRLRSGDFGRVASVATSVIWPRGASYYEGHDWRRWTAEGGGSLMNQGFHHLDLVQWMIGPWSQPTHVGSRVHEDIDRDEDAVTVVGHLEHADRPIGTAHVATAGPPGATHESLFVTTDRALIEARGFRLADVRVGDQDASTISPHMLNDFLYSALVQDVTAAIRGLPTHAATLSDVRPALQVALDQAGSA